MAEDFIQVSTQPDKLSTGQQPVAWIRIPRAILRHSIKSLCDLGRPCSLGETGWQSARMAGMCPPLLQMAAPPGRSEAAARNVEFEPKIVLWGGPVLEN